MCSVTKRRNLHIGALKGNPKVTILRHRKATYRFGKRHNRKPRAWAWTKRGLPIVRNPNGIVLKVSEWFSKN